jgi:hypothetical protein
MCLGTRIAQQTVNITGNKLYYVMLTLKVQQVYYPM